MTAENYSAKHELQKNDILFARTGATVGKTYFYDGSIGKAIFAGYCIRFRFNENRVMPKFVYWYTKTDTFLSWVNGIQRPSGQPNINKEEYKSYKILVPSKSEQEWLSSFMDIALAERTKMLYQADSLLANANDYLFNQLRFKSIDYKRRVCCAVTQSNVVADKTFSAEYYHPERMAAIHALKSNTNITAYRLSDIVEFCRDLVNLVDNDDYLGLASVESQTGELSGIHEKAAGQAFIYKKGDVLYGRLRPYLNKVLFAEKSGVCSTEFHVMRVINCEKVLPEYVAAILRSDLILSQTRHMMTGNTHPRISNDDVKNLYIPVPELAVQIEIVTELHNRRVQARRLKEEAELNWKAAKEQFEKELLGE